MKKFLTVIIILLLSCGSSFALFESDSESDSSLESLLSEREKINQFDVKFDDGLRIQYLGSYIYNDDGNIHVFFMVTSKIDTVIDTSAGMLYDDKGGRFYLESTRMSGYRVSKLDVIENVPTVILFEYPSVYERKLRNKNIRNIASVIFTINGHELIYRGIPMENWAACLEKFSRLGFISKREWFQR
ncbi:MAG: hypothetical protein IJS99_10110 [Synergistaceae bacterium]|nr:hypothetical protein [Synergistaceae bacterium]